MVSYMLSNSHIIDRFLDKEFIDINDVFSDVCTAGPITHTGMNSQNQHWAMDIKPKPLLISRAQTMARFSIDGTTLSSYPRDRPTPSLTSQSNYQFVTRIYVTSWRDGLIWINPAIQQNFIFGGSFLIP